MSFVAISKVIYPASIKDEICRVGLAMPPVTKRQPGFIPVSFHHAWAAIMEKFQPVFARP